MCASSCSKYNTAHKNKRPRRGSFISIASWAAGQLWLRHCTDFNSIFYFVCFADQLQEQHQRYCFPVRPVQRVQHQQQPSTTAGVLRLRPPTTPNATVGVVTPNTTNGNEEQQAITSSTSVNNNYQAPTALQTVVHRLFGSTQGSTRSQIEVLRTLLGLEENWSSGSNGQQTAGSLVEVRKLLLIV